ncbi:MAG: DNA repair and recombination protein RadB [Archaeoglobi archaeon]|nr:DNA repair and recombination protein RadB [Candidatus Mnemosynella bozhongmuii]
MKFSTGSRRIDELLGGGFESGIITQIYGAPGTGKTNIAIQTAVECARRGKKAVIIDTEGLSAERISQIAGDDLERVSKLILIYRPRNLNQQTSALRELPRVLDNTGVVIVDSITSFYRFELAQDELGARKELAQQLAFLMGVARKYDVAVIVTNQVYADIERNELLPVGGLLLQHASKVILELRREGNRRIAVLRKHRSRPEGLSCEFEITGKGVF